MCTNQQSIAAFKVRVFYKPEVDEGAITQQILNFVEVHRGATIARTYLPSDGVADNDKGFSCEVDTYQLYDFFNRNIEDLVKIIAEGPVPVDAKGLMEETIPRGLGY